MDILSDLVCSPIIIAEVTLASPFILSLIVISAAHDSTIVAGNWITPSQPITIIESNPLP